MFIMQSLSTAFLQKLVARLDDENTIGVLLEGSFSRGEVDRYGDVDLYHYLRQIPAGRVKPYSLQVVDGYLVSVSQTSLELEYASLRIPEQAVWSIPALRQARLLLDKEGLLAALQEAARQAIWEPLQEAANAYAASNLSGCSEEVCKILSGMERRDESKTLYAVWGLTRGLVNSLLVQGGVFITSENNYIDAAQQAAGRTSTWTRQFRLAIGLDPLPPGAPAYVGFGGAGLQLYRETAALLRDILQPANARVIDQTLEIMTEAGF